ncbi:MAG: deoxyribodipyrimidine photolyase, partial [Betaproteobacteria bacterium]|nr:deoxyribodipyrimidine photolyase [Betaproteobacteria bacterium]
QTAAGLEVGASLAQPLVDLTLATRESKQRLHSRRQDSDVRAGKKAVIEKHASRKTLSPRRASSQYKTQAKQQLGFDF